MIGTAINARNWDMYKDDEQLDLINNVNCLNNTNILPAIGTSYWIAVGIPSYASMFKAASNGRIANKVYNYGCYGMRPVVTMNDGVYIAGGDGTEASPYILAKEE